MSANQDNPWKILNSKCIYENPWIRVREDNVIRPDGRPGIYGVVEARKIATGVIALNERSEIFLIGQYRYPTRHYSWEIVEGGAEIGEAPMDAAKRELREEAGLIASNWEQLGTEVHLSNCVSDEIAVFFVARNLTEVEVAPDGTEVLQRRCVPLTKALQMVDSGEIKDAMSIIALLRFSRITNK
ncbi:MAG: NUDIX hydrolase [Oligoflexia bacterium]|nr:NUDIX hydrolase [Oligoflexia bacterium]